jgi:hypothetical protein
MCLSGLSVESIWIPHSIVAWHMSCMLTQFGPHFSLQQEHMTQILASAATTAVPAVLLVLVLAAELMCRAHAPPPTKQPPPTLTQLLHLSFCSGEGAGEPAEQQQLCGHHSRSRCCKQHSEGLLKLKPLCVKQAQCCSAAACRAPGLAAS